MSSYKSSSHHSFDINLAAQLGSVELAIIVHHFQYWINHNQKLNKNFIDNRTWTYQTREDIAAHFPYFSSSQVRRFTDKLVQLKILRKANHNRLGLDKTLWYSFENEKMFTIGKFDNSIDDSDNRDDEIGKAIPNSKPQSITKYNKDLGLETEVFEKNSSKTLDAPRRWGLSEEEKESFEVLKSLGIDAEDKKLCYWVKKYPLKRILDVFNESKSYKPKSLKLYMSKLLDENKAVPNCNNEANRQFALDYLKSNQWHGVKIYKKYMKCPVGNDFSEIDFNMESVEFINRLIEKHLNSEKT